MDSRNWRLIALLPAMACVMAFPVSLHAQCPTTIPGVQEYGTGSYSVKQVGGSCLPLTVNVKSTLPGAAQVRTLFDYRGGPIKADSLTTDTLHTYARPGKYTIVQFSEKDGRKLIACPSVFVYDTLPPAVRLVPCRATNVKLVFADQQPAKYDSYWISWDDGNIQQLSTYAKSAVHVYDRPAVRNITVWGTINPGLCRSRDVILAFKPDSQPEKPALSAFKMLDAGTGELEVLNPMKSELLLFRKTEGGDWESTGRTVTMEQAKLKVIVDSLSYLCFRLQPTDTCLAASYRSDVVCSALFSLEASEQANTLTWQTSPLLPDAIVTIHKDEVLWKNLSTSTGTLVDPDLSCGQVHCYRLIIGQPGSQFISLPRCRRTPAAFCGVFTPLFVPDAFSPNGDGLNDVFEVKGEVGSSFTLTVFSPWGSVLFQTTDIRQSWNGKYQEEWVAPGHYPYSITVNDPKTGKHHTRRGSVLLIK